MRDPAVVRVTRLGQTTELVLNAELILSIEATPDTVITLTTGHKYVIQETVDEVVRRVIAYKQAVRGGTSGP